MNPKLAGFLALIFFTAIANATPSEEILVEAARIDRERIDPSRSVTILTEKDLAAKNATTVADALRDVPGVQLIQQGGAGQTASVFIRGARSEGTLVLIDDVEVNDASSPGCGFDFSSLSTSNIERIEIYRGPQSVRFGAGALGGVINIVTKEGYAGRQMSYAVEGGSYETKRGLFQMSGGAERLGYSAALEGFQSAGFSAASEGKENDGANIGSASGKLNWRLPSYTDISTNFRYTKARVDLDRQGGAAGDDPNMISNASQFTAGVSARTRLLEERLKASAGVSVSENNRSSQNDPDPADTTESSDEFFGRNTKAHIDGDFLFDENQTLRLSLQSRTETAHSDSVYSGFATPISEKTQTTSGASVTYLFESETWFSDAGIRQDKNSTIGAVDSGRISFGRKFSESGSKATLTYGTGFKLPSLYQLYSSYGDETLEAEKASSVDFSLEQELGARSVVTVTYFETRFSNLIDFNTTTSKYFNVLKANSKGVEASLMVRVSASDEIMATYTYLDAKDESTGLGLLRRPYNSFGLEALHRENSYDAFIHYRYRGARPDIDPVSFSRTENPAYDLWGIGGAYKFSKSFQVNARVENLFNKKYEEAAGYATAGLSFFAGISGDL